MGTRLRVVESGFATLPYPDDRARPLRGRELEWLARPELGELRDHAARLSPQPRSMTTPSDEADRLWAAPGDPMRIRLLDLLSSAVRPQRALLAGALPITRQGVSKHLAVLERNGLVTAHRSGREVRYAVRGNASMRPTPRWQRIRQRAGRRADRP